MINILNVCEHRFMDSSISLLNDRSKYIHSTRQNDSRKNQSNAEIPPIYPDLYCPLKVYG